MERHNNFDLLRLLAALSVIFSHAFLLAENSQDHDPLMILTGGQAILGLAGVFVFFTISGYLISQSFEATPSPFVFLAKRALRISPGLFGCLIVCVFAIGPLVTNLPPGEYLAKPETWLFLLHNAVLDIHYNRLPGVVFWPGNIGGIVNGPLWSLPCEALLYLMLFGLGVCRLLSLPVSLILLATGILCLQIDLSTTALAVRCGCSAFSPPACASTACAVSGRGCLRGTGPCWQRSVWRSAFRRGSLSPPSRCSAAISSFIWR